MNQAEIAALIDRLDDEAEAFLAACVHFAKFMQLEVECSTAIDVLRVERERMLEKLDHYQALVDPVNGKLLASRIKAERRGGVGI